MIAIRTPSKKRVRLLALMVIGIASPLAFSPKTAIAANDVSIERNARSAWSETGDQLPPKRVISLERNG